MTRRRRSKVRSKTRSESSHVSDEEILYCVCRTSDGTRFMIACDNCEEWYHGDCINVTPKQAANIKRFFCHLCVGRNPSLEIEYKTGKEERVRLPNLRQQIKKINFSSEDDENDADLSSSSSPDKSLGSAKRAMRKRCRPISESVGKKRRGRPKERMDDYDEEATEDEIETSGFVPSIDEEGVYCGGQVYSGASDMRINASRTPSNAGRGTPKINQRTLVEQQKGCGICEGCKVIDDCGQCEVCTRYGVSMKGVCRKRRCVQGNYRCQVRKSYHATKNYGTINDEDVDGVVDDSADYHRPMNSRRRNEFEIGEIRQRLTSPLTTNKNACAVGSKMRRGDHLPGGGNSISQRRGLTNVNMPYKCYGEESLEAVNGSSFRYQYQGSNNRLSRNQSSHNQLPSRARRTKTESDAALVAQMSSNTSSVSGRMSSHHYIDEFVEDSDEDVMIPNELLSPINGQRLLNQTDSKTHCSYVQASQALNNDQRLHEYGLSYQDHLYCKHHRSSHWQGAALVAENSVPSSDVLTASRTDLSTKQSDQDFDSLRPSSPAHHFTVIERPSKGVTRLVGNDFRQHRKPTSLKSLGSISTEKRLNLCSDSVVTPDSFVTRLFNDESYQMVDLNDSLSVTSNVHHTSQASNEPPHSATASLFSHNRTHTQDFYTINDEDDLEINWPKDTVNV